MLSRSSVLLYDDPRRPREIGNGESMVGMLPYRYFQFFARAGSFVNSRYEQEYQPV